MNDFKTLPKMQCFKTGGSVQSKPKAMCYGGKMKKGGEVDAADMAQDKKIVKKGYHGNDKLHLQVDYYVFNFVIYLNVDIVA
jgi:hypothetical protein